LRPLLNSNGTIWTGGGPGPAGSVAAAVVAPRAAEVAAPVCAAAAPDTKVPWKCAGPLPQVTLDPMLWGPPAAAAPRPGACKAGLSCAPHAPVAAHPEPRPCCAACTNAVLTEHPEPRPCCTIDPAQLVVVEAPELRPCCAANEASAVVVDAPELRPCCATNAAPAVVVEAPELRPEANLAAVLWLASDSTTPRVASIWPFRPNRGAHTISSMSSTSVTEILWAAGTARGGHARVC